MKRNRTLFLLAASVGIAGCGDQASKLLAPTSAAETGSSSGGSGTGYTWTIKKELVEVHGMTPDGGMPARAPPARPRSCTVARRPGLMTCITAARTGRGRPD